MTVYLLYINFKYLIFVFLALFSLSLEIKISSYQLKVFLGFVLALNYLFIVLFVRVLILRVLSYINPKGYYYFNKQFQFVNGLQ